MFCSLDQNTAEHFALTINQLKGKVGMLFVTHGMPKTLQVDEIVRIGQGSLSAVATEKSESTSQGGVRPKDEAHVAQAMPTHALPQGGIPHSQEPKTEGRMEA